MADCGFNSIATLSWRRMCFCVTLWRDDSPTCTSTHLSPRATADLAHGRLLRPTAGLTPPSNPDRFQIELETWSLCTSCRLSVSDVRTYAGALLEARQTMRNAMHSVSYRRKHEPQSASLARRAYRSCMSACLRSMFPVHRVCAEECRSCPVSSFR